MSWTPVSWKDKPIRQQPEYKDRAAVDKVCAAISELPPLVADSEVERLRSLLGEVAVGKRFLLQGGDCAERFQDCAKSPIDSKLKILLQMSLVLVWGGRVPVVRVGRIAGQYAKPRSKGTEPHPEIEGEEIPVFRGDIVNAHPLAEGREADPERLREAYFRSAATLNYIRARLAGGFADLHAASKWDLSFVDESKESRSSYQGVLDSLRHCLDFLGAIGVGGDDQLKGVEFYTSHEGLLLDYEAALTRKGDESDAFYDLSAHLLWIGDRTRNLDGAHIEFFRGIRNPIGLKVGPTTDKGELVELIKTLDPENDPGRLILYSRLGAGKVRDLLPDFIKTVREAGCTNVIWACDPMHGNTTTTKSGIKTRAFDNILTELLSTFEVHEECGSRLGGVHFEATGEDVTECTGGATDLGEDDLGRNFVSFCDPRLNYSQSMEISFRVAQYLQSRKASSS